VSPARRIALLAGSVLTLSWLRRRAHGPRVICDVCFQRVDPAAETCAHCGTVFGDTSREQHEVVPEMWVAAQIGRLRAMTYEGLLGLSASPQHYEVPVDDGRSLLSGEVQVFWDDPGKAEGDLRVIVAIWNDAGGRPLASDDFIRALDGSFVDEQQTAPSAGAGGRTDSVLGIASDDRQQCGRRGLGSNRRKTRYGRTSRSAFSRPGKRPSEAARVLDGRGDVSGGGFGNRVIAPEESQGARGTLPT
jgi:hypothetical protein